MAEPGYTVDYRELWYTADDTAVYTEHERKTSGKASSRRHTDYCKACYMVGVHIAADRGLYTEDTTHHMSPATYTDTMKSR